MQPCTLAVCREAREGWIGSTSKQCLSASSAPLPPRSYIGSDLVGNLQRRVSGVSAARVDVDNDIVSERQRALTAPAGVTGILLSRGGTQYALRVGKIRPTDHCDSLCVWMYWLQAGHCWAEASKNTPAFSAVGNNTTACLR